MRRLLIDGMLEAPKINIAEKEISYLNFNLGIAVKTAKNGAAEI